ncbi:uncharacterized protein UV8b_03128 [Ustilaginoidea virens]|uniref:HypA-like protein n=1 Tax=Ustilaginoidea virens TaxID=1159556 RepID=A0A8E5MGH0_USTVR|nr:uncharacterized protein UV8b_03128 [Ustilaginoidea virens]QUC18887.1 hypothetical protein UV8b_03128 [Ustilaginoidea virens]
MATAYKIAVRASGTRLCKVQQTEEAASKVSELLQEDLQKHHTFFNDSGFHNHLAHQLLTLYGTGAAPSTLQAAYDANRTYQLAAKPVRDSVVALLQDWPANAPSFLGRGDHYPDFLSHFQREIERRGWQAVVEEHLCRDTPQSRDMVQRLFSGIAHPMIHLAYGLEWEQPALVAAGLAQAAVHPNRLGEFFDKVDKATATAAPAPSRRSLAEVCEAVRADHPDLVATATFNDDNPLYNGVLGTGLQEAVELAATLTVGEDDVDERTAELLHLNAYVAAAAAAGHPPHLPKFDFFLLHSLTSAPFVLSFNKPFIPLRARVRMLEHKMRFDLMQYIARGSPPLGVQPIRDFRVSRDDASAAARPQDLLPRYHAVPDDGHLVKVARALLLAEQESGKWKGRPWIRLQDGRDWLNVHHMLLRGVEGQKTLWVMGAGFQEAWKDVPEL